MKRGQGEQEREGEEERETRERGGDRGIARETTTDWSKKEREGESEREILVQRAGDTEGHTIREIERDK